MPSTSMPGTLRICSSRLKARSPEWRGFEYEAYVFTALVYWVICYGMSKYSQALEQRLHRGHANDLQAR